MAWVIGITISVLRILSVGAWQDSVVRGDGKCVHLAKDSFHVTAERVAENIPSDVL